MFLGDTSSTIFTHLPKMGGHFGLDFNSKVKLVKSTRLYKDRKGQTVESHPQY